MKTLKIGELTARIPVIQGGMGVGISLSGLAGSVAACGGVGVISTAQIGYRDPEFEKNPIKTNLRVIGEEIQKAREIAKGGILGVNIMVATKQYAEYVKAAVKAGIDLIISGAGLPMELPKLVEGSKTKIAPIVSTVKAARVICRFWDHHYQRMPDLVVIEGPKAGGHLGYEIRKNFFTSSSDWVFQTSEDGATLQEDFKQGHANCRKIISDLSYARYISYQPLKYNGWMLCYIIPAVDARQPFAFINNFEIILFAFFICIVLLLIFALWKINQKNQTSLLRQAHTDALTGLLNKVYAEHTISEWLREKDFEDLQALMMIDMDYFKQINDTYGHATGDQVLKIFAGFLKEQFRATDIIGRVGGDEFMILMKNVRLDYSIHLHLQKLYTNLQNIDIPELNDQKLSCSIGCAVAPTDAESFSQLYRLADHALYTAKHNGRGRFVIYHDIKNQQETVLS